MLCYDSAVGGYLNIVRPFSLALILSLCATACKGPFASEYEARRQVVMATLLAEKAEWAATFTPNDKSTKLPCVKPKVSLFFARRVGNVYRIEKGASMRIDQSWLPADFEICDRDSKGSYFRLSDLLIYKSEANLSLEFGCGVWCGSNYFLHLKQNKGVWKVIEKHQTSVS